MNQGPFLALAFALVVALPAAARAETLSLSRVIELASVTAPEVRLAQGREAQAEARLMRAGVLTLDNPKLDLAAGRRGV